ncbi:phage portal protein [Escherichia coli]|uniref:phage portal protein n=2 Tax=Escherichia coli TaxID=562 RepID=UPI0030792547
MFFSGLFQRKSDAPMTTPAELADAIGLSYDTYTGKQISSQRAMRLTAVFSCVRVLAESVGMLPCNLYHLNGSLKQRATGERLHKLISTHPNGYMTPQEFWELVVTCLCLRGNFYAYKVKAFGEVAELLPVDPGCVVPKLNSSWEPIYQVTFPDGSTDVLSQEDIWHVRTLTLDGLVGLNPIAYGVLRVPIACSSAGAVGNADDGTSLILVTPVNGLPSSGVADTLTGGFDTEELETWRARVIERYYWTPQGGADGDYVVWAKEVPGITRAWTYRHWMGTGTVGVMIASSDLINPIPEESTETAARQHIGPLAPVAGSDLYVFRPVVHTVDFHIRVTPDTPEIRAAITAELRSFLLRDGYPQGELKVSRISEAISGANGEYSHQLLAPVDNISIAKNELAVLGTISWT